MKVEFIGREIEKSILQAALDSKEAEMVAVIGRRRVSSRMAAAQQSFWKS
jgi:hypothetical protein